MLHGPGYAEADSFAPPTSWRWQLLGLALLVGVVGFLIFFALVFASSAGAAGGCGGG